MCNQTFFLLCIFLQLAGNFVKNTRRAAVYILASDINVSMSADPVRFYFKCLLYMLKSHHLLIYNPE